METESLEPKTTAQISNMAPTISIAHVRIFLAIDIAFCILTIICSIILYYYRKPYILILTITVASLLFLTVYIWVLIENAGNGNEITRYYFLIRGTYFFCLLVYTLFLFIETLVFAGSFLRVYLFYLPFLFYLSLIVYEISAIGVSLLVSLNFKCLRCEDLNYNMIFKSDDLRQKLERLTKLDNLFYRKNKTVAVKEKDGIALSVHESEINSLKAIRPDIENTPRVLF